jgi:hypothetical protein
MKKIFLLLLSILMALVANAQCSTNCNQMLSAFSYTKYNSFVNTTDNWQYFGSQNQTRVRVVAKYTSTPTGAVIGLGVCGCPNGVTVTNECVVKLEFTVEAESKVGTGGWKKRALFKPDFRLVFSGVSVLNKGNYLYDDPNNTCDGFGNCNVASTQFYINNNTGYDGVNNIPSNWTDVSSWTIQANNTNFNTLNVSPTGNYKVTQNKWFTHHPSLSGTVQCYVKIAGNGGWANIGTITL